MKIGDAGLVQRPNSENPGLCPTITRLFLGLAKRKWYQSLSLEKGYKMHIFTKDLEKVPKSRRDGLRGTVTALSIEYVSFESASKRLC